jgi:antitoxin component of MazEF toxin-antitoxin module
MNVIVKKIGNDLVLVIPRAVAKKMPLTEGTALGISSIDAEIILRRRGGRLLRPDRDRSGRRAK